MQVSELKDGECLRVPLAVLVDAPWGNVRQGKRDPKKYSELLDSIKGRGVTQSITIRPNDEDNTLEVLAGYGRRQASAEAGHIDIPALVKRVDDREAMAIGLSENLNREDLSILDEIRISQSFVSLFDADYEEAANRVGWTERQLRARLKLNDCSEAVLEALGENKIKLGHAEVLCQFVHKLQDGTLAKIIDENWSVDQLKERASKATRFLRHAKFDTSECDSCPHNSSVQTELFDNHVGHSKCGNLPCYREKSDAWIQAQKAVLENEEGTVFLAVEKPESDRNTVSAEVVGEAAFTEDCLSCVSRTRILIDGINKDCGTVIDNQCINLSCFRDKLKALAEQHAKPTATKKPGKKSAAKANGKAATATKPTLSSGMKEQARQFARSVIGQQLLENERYRLAVGLVGLADMTGYKPQGKSLGLKTDGVNKLASLSVAELKEEIAKALTHGTVGESDGTDRFGGTDVVLAASNHVDGARDKVVAAWKPTKEWFSSYQKGAIQGFCKQKTVEFDKAFDAIHGGGSFEKLMNKKKDEIISAILDASFDWSAIAPKELVDLVK